MRKLTTEQKAEAYDKALERAKVLMTKGYDVLMPEIFPELKESEDEKVRKEIISHLQYLAKYCKESMPNVDKWIAWLEKQGEYKKSYMMDKRKSPYSEKRDFGYFEEKPANKIRTEFHEGDWVIYKNDICQIIKREEGCNKLVTVFGIEKELVNERNLSTAHLWTIQDAKPGDVLAIEPIDNYQYPFVAIYKDGCLSHFNSYCMIAFNGKFYIDETGHQANVHPATKEQRDLLFEKMKKAGYEWDANKKELKIDYPDNLPKDNWELIFEFVKKFGRIPEDVDELNVLVDYVLKRQKSAK